MEFPGALREDERRKGPSFWAPGSLETWEKGEGLDVNSLGEHQEHLRCMVGVGPREALWRGDCYYKINR